MLAESSKDIVEFCSYPSVSFGLALRIFKVRRYKLKKNDTRIVAHNL